jgi:hypothetical protein
LDVRSTSTESIRKVSDLESIDDDRLVELFAGDLLLGRLRVTFWNHPSLHYTFEPAAGFERYAELFRRERELAKSSCDDDCDDDERFRMYGEITATLDALNLYIMDRHGVRTELRQIIIDGVNARWRIGFLRILSERPPHGDR